MDSIRALGASLCSYGIEACRKLGRYPAVYRLYRAMPGLRKFNRTPMYIPPSNAMPQLMEGDEKTRELRTLFAETLLLLARARVTGWWNFHRNFALFHFNQTALLRQILREFVLRRAGDYRAFLILSKRLDACDPKVTPEDHFIRLAAERFAAEMADMKEIKTLAQTIRASGKRPFLTGFPVWGERYVKTFLEIGLPSLMAEGNFPFLCQQRHLVLIIHTDEAGRAMLEGAAQMQQLERMGASILYRALDARLLGHVRDAAPNTYWHLGMIQSVQLQCARLLQADSHCMFPDKIYASHYFESLLRAARGADVLIQWGFRTHKEEMLKSIAPYYQANCLSIPSPDLAAMALNHLHPAVMPLLMNSRQEGLLPNAHGLLWESGNALYFICPHQDMVYLDRAVTSRLKQRFFYTPDSDLHRLIPKKAVLRCPQAKDGLALVELSPGDMFEPSEPVGIREYCRMFWHRIESMEHLRFFNEDNIFALNTALRDASRLPMGEEDIRREKQWLRGVVGASFPRPGFEAIVNGLLALHATEVYGDGVKHWRALHLQAKALWEGRDPFFVPVSDPEIFAQIPPLLEHFGLPYAAREFMSSVSPTGRAAEREKKAG